MHGLLYGPGLSELQSLFLSFGMPVIFASKIPGVLALLVSVVLFGRIFQDNFARSYLVLLIPFGVFLFWNRAEPLFLLLIVLSISLLARSRNTGTALLIGCFAGFATCLKLHAMLYVFAAVVVVWQSELLTVKRCLAMTAGWLVTVFVAFSPSQVSPSNFVLYLELAGKHGISVSGLSRNLFCLAILFAPVIFLTVTRTVKSRKQFILIAILFTVELVVATIASKPGAGPHHLLPFIPINAFLILQMVRESPHIERSLMPFKFGILTISLGSLFMLILLARQMCLQYPLQLELKEEADSLADKYPGIVLGVSDSENYDYVFFRPLLEAKGNRQIDYPAYMDLNFSGVTDYRFVQTLRACKIRYLALPVYGEPFSIINSYTGQPLFSQAVRASFGEYYTTIAETNHYRVYRCKIETVE
jgi:hypothetical protein